MNTAELMKLADAYSEAEELRWVNKDAPQQAREALQSAIESLQAEKDEIEKNGIDLIDDLHKAWAERDALQARINELEQGEPVAYMHTMDNTDGLEGNEPEIVVTFNISNPFGIPGVHYSKSYPVTCEPLYTRPAKTQPLTDERNQDDEDLQALMDRDMGDN